MHYDEIIWEPDAAKEKIIRIFNNKCDTIIKKIVYSGAELELCERPAVAWAGCVDFAADHVSESDYMSTLKRYQDLVAEAAPQHCINPDWSAAILINYKRGDRPCGMPTDTECRSFIKERRIT